MLVQLRRLDWFHLVFNSKMYIFKSDINLNKSNVRQLDDEIADLAFQLQYESWTWRTETTFHAFKLGLDWVLMVLISLFFWSKKFLVFLVSLLVFHWMFSQDLTTAQLMINWACRWKLHPVWFESLSTGMALGSLASFLWLFNHILEVSAFPTYWILRSSRSSKYMMKLLLQVVFWNILNVLLVWLLLKCSVFITCLQQLALEFEKHGEHFPFVNLLVVSSFLFLSIVFPWINCFRFLFLLKANWGFFQIPF